MNQQEQAAAIFKKMIDMGYYKDIDPFMCHCLDRALGDENITPEERNLAVMEIKETLARSGFKCISLGGTLQRTQSPLFQDNGNYTFIYENWMENRPF